MSVRLDERKAKEAAEKEEMETNEEEEGRVEGKGE